MTNRPGRVGPARAWPGMIFLTLMAVPASVFGQASDAGRPGPRIMLSLAEEVALARSAAPAAVSSDATVYAWNGEAYDVAVEGTNGVSCYVGRSWPESLEPHCFDTEGSRTILPIHLYETALLAQGAERSEIDAGVAEGLRTGRFRLPARPAMSYMMSAGQRLISDEGVPVGAWEPHLMIYYPWMTAEDLGLGSEASLAAGLVVDPGTPLSTIVVLVRDFVQVEEESR